MPKKQKQINYEERNGKKRVLFLLGLTVVLTLGSIAVMVLIPYLNTLPLYRSFFKTYTTAYISEESVLSPENTFYIDTTNSDGHGEELIIGSEDANVELGDFNNPKYIFADRGSIDSNIFISFSLSGANPVDIITHMYVCTEDGSNITMLDNKDASIIEGNPYIISFNKEEDIFVNRVTVSYKVRIK